MTSTLRLTHIALHVRDLARSRDFYVERLGFHPVATTAYQLDLAVSPTSAPIFTLLSAPHSTPSPADAAGLFHAALLFPSRSALASWLAFAAAQHIEFDGFSDHGVSEAIYLTDPDGNGLEFYADRPRDTWPFHNGELAMTTRPLPVRELLALAHPTPAPLADATWGHLHLRVTDLDRSETFYRNTLDLAVTQRSYPGACFLAADGYHHHLGLNTWGHPHRPHSPSTTGLAGATFATAAIKGPTTVTDPDNIPLKLTPLA